MTSNRLSPFVFSLLLVSASVAAPVVPPSGSWEAWVLGLRRPDLARLLSSVRPDRKAIGEPLPLWVDCHLSWIADHPKLGRAQKLPRGLTLRATPRKCKGQIEEWAL